MGMGTGAHGLAGFVGLKAPRQDEAKRGVPSLRVPRFYVPSIGEGRADVIPLV